MALNIPKFIRLSLSAWVIVAFLPFMAPLSGSARADYDAGVKAYNNKDYKTALREFQREAEQGDPYAQQAIGLIYEKGRGVEVDLKQAARWYHLAADQNEPLAAVNLGILYRDGKGVGQDFAKARHYLTIGAMQDDPAGQNALGALYANGQGVARNDVEAYAWFLLAAGEGGDEELAPKNLKLLQGRMSESQLAAAEKRNEEIGDRMDNGASDPGPVAGDSEQEQTSRQDRTPLKKGYEDRQKGAEDVSSKWSQELMGGTDSAPTQANHAQWVVYKDASGMSLEHPADWKVKSDKSGTLGLSNGQGETLIIWPFLGQGALSDASAGRIVEQATRAIEPAAKLSGVAKMGSHAVRSAGQWGGREFVAAAAWNSGPQGDPGVYTLASAPAGRLNEIAPTFADILATLKMAGKGQAGGGTGKTAAGVQFARWTDPKENAFTVDVPKGWRVTGGVARFNAVDVRPSIRAVSPDGGMTVFIGDSSIPSFLTPNEPLRRSGFPEGSVYDAGYNQRFTILRYLPGQAAAKSYYDMKFGGACQGARQLDYRERPETTQEINAIFKRHGLPFMIQRLDAGEVSMACDASGRASYVFAGTFLTQMPTPQGTFGMWVMNFLHGYDAPQADASQASAILDHMTSSLKMNPEWLRMNTQNAAALSKIVTETGAAISKAVSSSYWTKVKVDDRLSVARSQAMRGVEDVYDPVTRQKIEVKSGSDYYWIDARGTCHRHADRH